MNPISREEFVRILGEEKVKLAETFPEDQYEERKWERISQLLHVYEKLIHTQIFEARRSYILGLDPEMQVLIIRHVNQTQTA
jgi:hypothetical protein